METAPFGGALPAAAATASQLEFPMTYGNNAGPRFAPKPANRGKHGTEIENARGIDDGFWLRIHG